MIMILVLSTLIGVVFETIITLRDKTGHCGRKRVHMNFSALYGLIKANVDVSTEENGKVCTDQKKNKMAPPSHPVP